MNYVAADFIKAREAGFSEHSHVAAGGFMILNAKEISVCPALTGSADERAMALGGRLMTAVETKLFLQNLKNNSDG